MGLTSVSRTASTSRTRRRLTVVRLRSLTAARQPTRTGPTFNNARLLSAMWKAMPMRTSPSRQTA